MSLQQTHSLIAIMLSTMPSLGAATEIRHTTYNFIQNKKLTGTITATYHARSVQECASLCEKDLDCITVNFANGDEQCEILALYNAEGEVAIEDQRGWTTICK